MTDHKKQAKNIAIRFDGLVKKNTRRNPYSGVFWTDLTIAAIRIPRVTDIAGGRREPTWVGGVEEGGG